MVRLSDSGPLTLSGMVAPDDELSQQQRQALEPFVAAGLLSNQQGTGPGDKAVRANDELIRRWARLAAWAEADLPFLRWRQALSSSMQQWSARERQSDLLLAKPLVDAGREWVTTRAGELSRRERDYFEQSRVYGRVGQFQRGQRVVAAVSSLLVAVMATALYQQYRSAQTQLAQNETVRAAAASTQAELARLQQAAKAHDERLSTLVSDAIAAGDRELRLARHERAAWEYTNAIRLSGGASQEAVLKRADAFRELGRTADAIGDYKKFLEGSPTSQQANFGLGVLYAGMKVPDARDYLRKAAESDADLVLTERAATELAKLEGRAPPGRGEQARRKQVQVRFFVRPDESPAAYAEMVKAGFDIHRREPVNSLPTNTVWFGCGSPIDESDVKSIALTLRRNGYAITRIEPFAGENRSRPLVHVGAGAAGMRQPSLSDAQIQAFSLAKECPPKAAR